MPRGLAVAGIDDHELAGFFGLSTIAQYLWSPGQRAVQVVMVELGVVHRADRDDPDAAENVILPFDLIQPASTGPPDDLTRRPARRPAR